jgi:hypothetical protein
MNIDCFLKLYTDVLMNDNHDNVFDTLKIITGGTTSSRIAKLLNFSVSQMDDNECYLEVGVFTGSTLCAAGYNNEKLCIGIDKYNEDDLKEMSRVAPSELRDRCLYNMKCLASRSILIEKDFRDVKKEEIQMPVGVSFIDGKHDYEDVTKNLEWLEPFLADNAILVFDDVNYFDVSRAIFDWLMNHRENYDLLSYNKPFFLNCEYISSLYERFLNNGVCVILFHRKPFPIIGMVGVK